MSRLTRNQEKFWGKGNYKGEKYIIGSDGVTSKQMCLNKLGKLEDLEEEIGVNNLIAFLEWCVKFRNNFINRSFDDMVAFYKRAMCVTERG